MSTLLPRRVLIRRVSPFSRSPKRGPKTHLRSEAVSQQAGLRFTEWVVLGALSLAYLFTVSMPIFGIPLQVTALKHFPLLMLAPALALHLMGMLINRQPMHASGIFAVCWPLVLMALFVITGSVVGKQLYKVDDSFLTFGVYLLLLPLLAAVPALPGDPLRWVRASAALWLIAALAALTGAAARLPTTQSLHEIEYLLVSAFVLLWFLAGGVWLKLLALLLMLAAAGLNHKLTGYIVVLLALVYIVLEAGMRRVHKKWRGFFAIVAVVLAVVVCGALALSYFQFRDVLPTGSPEVRMHQYQEAWRQFLNSPVWGTAYAEGSGEEFRESTRLYNIPTHSDVMDMLKHGGLIGFGLFAVGYCLIFRLFSQAAAATQGQGSLHAYFLGVRFFQISALATFSLNPLLLKGPFLVVIWGNLAVGVGLALAALRRHKEAAA
jgi:O-antigen ligase